MLFLILMPLEIPDHDSFPNHSLSLKASCLLVIRGYTLTVDTQDVTWKLPTVNK